MADAFAAVGILAISLSLSTLLLAFSYSLYKESSRDLDDLRSEVSRLMEENWTLRQALGVDEEDD